jgi:putative sigma-54 modulation protein
MRIDVVGKNLDITEALKTFATEKAGKLVKHFDDGVQQIVVRLDALAHKKGFHAEITVDVIKHEDFVANATHADLYAAIDEAVEKAARQLTDFKERLKQNKRGRSSAAG